jgi:Lon protease-like protein
VPSTPPAGSTELLPLFPLGTVLVPEMALSLHVFEPRYRQLVADLLRADDPGAPVFGVVALRQGWEVGELKDVFTIGTTARVTDVLPHPDGQCELAAVGERRFRIESLDTESRPYLQATVRYLSESLGDVAAGAVSAVRSALTRHLTTLAQLSPDSASRAAPLDARGLAYAVAQQSSLPLADRQSLLECPDTATRLLAARVILRRESELLRQLHAVPASAATFRTGQGSS